MLLCCPAGGGTGALALGWEERGRPRRVGWALVGAWARTWGAGWSGLLAIAAFGHPPAPQGAQQKYDPIQAHFNYECFWVEASSTSSASFPPPLVRPPSSSRASPLDVVLDFIVSAVWAPWDSHNVASYWTGVSPVRSLIHAFSSRFTACAVRLLSCAFRFFVRPPSSWVLFVRPPFSRVLFFSSVFRFRKR